MSTATLRPLDESDVADVARLLSDRRLVGRRGLPEDRSGPRPPSVLAESVRRLVDPEHGVGFVVEAGGMVGVAFASWWWDALTPDAWVVISPANTGRGHARSAGATLLDHLFTSTPALVVQADVPAWDADALSYAESMGAERIGVHRRTGIRNGRYHDDIAFALVRDRWEELRGARG